jgi:hypothetical protein
MECFERCVYIQAANERNTLRRRARLLKAAKDLGLTQLINRQEISQRVLEAKDQQAGRCFQALSAADRMAMERPRLQWLLPGLIPANDLTILGGRPKVGKTRLAIALAAAVLNGTSVFEQDRPTPREVVLVTDDQADGDTAEMLEALRLWEHPRLFTSRHFRLTETDTDRLLETIAAHPGALVIIDSLRSIIRSLACDENDPELGALLYDLKAAVIEAGGTLLMIHHCNKSEGLVGTEALSGHSAIAGAANGILTMHYLPDDKGRPLKEEPQRRLVREARSGEGFDLVINRMAASFYKVSTFKDWQKDQKEANEEEQRMGRMSTAHKEVLEVLHQADDWLSLKQVCEAIGEPWEDNGRGNGCKRVRDRLDKLAAQRFAEKDQRGRETTYRVANVGSTPSRRTQQSETTGTTGTTSDANASASSGGIGTTGTSSDHLPPAPEPPGPSSGSSEMTGTTKRTAVTGSSGSSGSSAVPAPFTAPPMPVIHPDYRLEVATLVSAARDALSDAGQVVDAVTCWKCLQAWRPAVAAVTRTQVRDALKRLTEVAQPTAQPSLLFNAPPAADQPEPDDYDEFAA